jgi:hypothetical protein
MVWSSVSPPDAEEKLKDIQRVADAELAGFGSRRLLTVLLERIQEIVGADTAAVLLLDRSSSELVAAETSGLEKAMRQGARVPLQQGFFAGQARPPVPAGCLAPRAGRLRLRARHRSGHPLGPGARS